MRSSRSSWKAKADLRRPARRRRAALGVGLVAALGAFAAHAVADWHVFSPPEGRFRVELPGEPALQTDSRLTPLGEVRDTRYWLEVDDAVLAVELHDVPPIAAAVMTDRMILDQARDGVIEHERGTPLDTRELTVQGAPACEFSYRLPAPSGEPDRIERALGVLVGSRLYLVTGTAGDPATHPAIGRFFASFRFWKDAEGE